MVIKKAISTICLFFKGSTIQKTLINFKLGKIKLPRVIKKRCNTIDRIVDFCKFVFI